MSARASWRAGMPRWCAPRRWSRSPPKSASAAICAWAIPNALRQQRAANILADALEALLGAIFLDAGLEAAAASVALLWGDRLSSRVAVPRDPKTALQEWAQARRLPLPVYLEVEREGPPHAPVFVVDAVLKGMIPRAAGAAASARPNGWPP